MEKAHDAAVQTSQRVAAAVQGALHNEAIREAVFEFGEVRILVTKGRRLWGEKAPLESPPEYPEVTSHLKDDADSWLK